MGELFDKEVNAQKESLKKLQGFTQAPRASPRKSVRWKWKKQTKQRNKKKNDVRVKMLLMEGSTI